MSSGTPIPAVVLGGSGYVAGELLRLLAGHPGFAVAAVASESRAGEPVVASFPHLAGTAVGELRFAGGEEVDRRLASAPRLAVFSALPHGESAKRVDALLAAAADAGREARVVDLSADFRHRDPATYAAIYGKPHPAPARLAEFVCALSEHANGEPVRHVAHPGCFTTAATLALAPLVAGGWIEPHATVVATTGSTGAGRAPGATTHHPERRSDLFAYAPFAHRHQPEMESLLAALAPRPAAAPTIGFAPQSGPFARGIHATAVVRLARPASGAELAAAARDFYAAAPFVRVVAEPPRLQAVVGTNRCDLAFAAHGGEAVAFAVLDNLVKGAAGGALQWMNRLFDRPETDGLTLAGLGWL